MAASVRSSAHTPDLAQEAALMLGGFRRIAGVDEVGRGAWAGPLVGAAVVLPDPLTFDVTLLAGVRDSKLLTHAQRDAAFDTVLSIAEDAGVGWANADEVDLLGVTAANELAMVRAVRALGTAPDHLLVDAFKLRSVDMAQRAIIRGDRTCLSIAAASVVAKVFRDRWLGDLASAYPAYGFEQHRGYGVAKHQAALASHGPCDLHRHSYAPLRALAGP